MQRKARLVDTQNPDAILRHLMHDTTLVAMDWIEQVRESARQAGVTRKENLPFLLPANPTTERAILLVHGFSASPREMLTLGQYLQNQGFSVLGVRLPGHGTSPADLASRRAEEWQETVELGYRQLAQRYAQVSALGLSTGALLVLKLALRHTLDRLILLSPFLKLKHPLTPYVALLHRFIPYSKKLIDPAEQPFYYDKRPLKGIAQINRLRRELRSRLGEIRVPTLVLAAAGDQTIAPGSAQELFRRLGSPAKQFHFYGEDTPHVLIAEKSPSRQDAFQRCRDFLAGSDSC
jgi:carboxylesterase